MPDRWKNEAQSDVISMITMKMIAIHVRKPRSVAKDIFGRVPRGSD
jgi:hypothetical protein